MLSITRRQTTSTTVTTRTPRVTAPQPNPTQHPTALLANAETWASIENWGTNTATSWLHPVSNRSYTEMHIAQRIPFKFIGDPSRNCTVEIVGKSAEYEKFKAIQMFGPFSAEAAFPWVKYSPTYLIHVKKV